MDFSEWQKRLSSIITLSVLIFTIFTGRLYQKAVVEHDEITKEADNQYQYRKEVTGERGQIAVKSSADTYYPLAANERRYALMVVPSNVRDPRATAAALAKVTDLKENDIFTKINNKKLLYLPALVHRLSREDAASIANLHLRGVQLLPELVRTYPEQGLASQIIGFVNNDGLGNYGIEGSLDAVLKGEKGYQIGERDSKGRLINVNDEVKPKNGVTIVLTIDREIQHFVEKALAGAVEQFQADSGTMVIVNPKTGAIIAMASVPSFNPNSFNTVTDPSNFGNAAISNAWEPGSIMKPLIMSLALDKGLVAPDTKQSFGASVRVLNHDIYTAEKKAFGLETMTQVLENSDNVGMVWIGDKLGNQSQFEGLKKFGFGTPPNLKLSAVAGGSIQPLKKWNDLTRATTTFGQGISVTPLQMTMAYAALANKGTLMQPYLINEVLDTNGVLIKTEPVQVARVVSEDTSKKISLMLESVVLNGLGKRAQVAGYRIGGKTGTAQVANPQGGYFDDKFVGSFAGYFPISDPQYAMVVKLDNPKTVKFAESSAGPTFGQIAAWVLSYKQVPPDKK